MKNQFAIAFGNAFDGLEMIGPFDDAERATEYAEQVGRNDYSEWNVFRLHPPVDDSATICVRAHGATMYFSFQEFADGTIQDDQVAIEIAERMLALPVGDEYPDNDDPSMPEAFCTYQVLNADVLRAQVEAAKEGV